MSAAMVVKSWWRASSCDEERPSLRAGAKALCLVGGLLHGYEGRRLRQSAGYGNKFRT